MFYYAERLHAASPKKYVLRLLETKDVRELLGEEVYLLWPDDGLWYPADVKKVRSPYAGIGPSMYPYDECGSLGTDDLPCCRSM